MKRKLSNNWIGTLKTTKSEEWHYDSVVPYLAIKITSAGSKIWYYRRRGRPAGRREKQQLGRFSPDLDAVAAAGLVRQLTQQDDLDRVSGLSSASVEAQSMTVHEVFAAWIDDRIEMEKMTSEKTQTETRGRFNLYLSSVQNRLFRDIGEEDIRQSIKKARTPRKDNRPGPGKGRMLGGKTAANRVLRLWKSLCIWAVENKIVATSPMPAKLKQTVEPSRDRMLSDAELPRFWKALHEAISQDYCDLFLLAWFTAKRVGKVKSMRWDDISFRLKLWSPKGNEIKKAGKSLLSDAAMQIIERRKADSDGSPFVFPSIKSECGHIVEYDRMWQTVCKSAGLVDFNVHDLKHVALTNLADTDGITIADLLLATDNSLHTAKKYLHPSGKEKNRQQTNKSVNHQLRIARGA